LISNTLDYNENDDDNIKKGKVLPYLLPTSQPAGDFLSHPQAAGSHYFPPGLCLYFVSVHHMVPPPINEAII